MTIEPHSAIDDQDVRALAALIVAHQTSQGVSRQETVNQLRRFGTDPVRLDAALNYISAQARHHQLLRIPGGMENLAYRESVETEAKVRQWYAGPETTGGENWPAFRKRLLDKGLSAAVPSIDQASTKVVSYLGDPHVLGLSVRGLVVGHVQSGKTSNFTAVIAKAADAGYRLFIVLSGIHNALRQQTQRRLESDLTDLVPTTWNPLTERQADFGPRPPQPGILTAPGLRSLAVVKKNATRLKNLRNWLESMPLDARRRCPTLIIDDESDQATPNTGDVDERTRINKLIIEIRELLPTSTYLGYTATPFANVLIDPTHEEDLYPADFIIALPQPESHDGPEVVFGRNPLDDADDPDDGRNIVRIVPDIEAEEYRPPSRKEDRASYDAPITDTLADALRWFILSCAVRYARGQQDAHMSMLVHTTMYANVHLQHRDDIDRFMRGIRQRVQAGGERELFRLQLLWEKERDAAEPEKYGYEVLEFSALRRHLLPILRRLIVVADNSRSDDRLWYGDDPQIVIAVGGNTLSRGLTLEGLATSYFVRAGRAYDTLLQMGRWFGFRKGYEDLPRVWMTAELEENFRFLALVEYELRQVINDMQKENQTPQQAAVKIRQHPTMTITAPAKMKHAQEVKLSYSGERLQTFLFEHRNEKVLEENLSAARELIARARATGATPQRVGRGHRWLLRGVPSREVIAFLDAYHFHEDHGRLRSELLIDYIEDRMQQDNELTQWNIAVMGSAQREHKVGDGEEPVILGEIDLGLDAPVGLVNRAQLKHSDPSRADIKSLMSQPDRYIDMDGSTAEAAGRRDPSTGLLLLYPISRASVPMGANRKAGSRKDLKAVEHVLGVGIVFPESTAEDSSRTYNASYVAVALPDEDPELDEQPSPEELDTEGDAAVDDTE